MDKELKFAIDNGMIDMSYVQNMVNMKKRQTYIENHPYNIWLGKNGRWFTYFPKNNKRILRSRKTKKDLEDLIIDFWENRESKETIKEIFDEWNDRRLRLNKISESTHYRNTAIFDKYLKEYEDIEISKITEEDISDWLEEQPVKWNMTSKAFSNLKTVLRGMLKRANKRKLISLSIENAIDNLDISSRDFKHIHKTDEQEVFSEEEMPKVIKYLKEHPDAQNLGLALMFATGMRVGELSALKHSDFDNHVVTIKRTEIRYITKDGVTHYDIKESPKTEAGFRTIVIPYEFDWLIKKIHMLNPFSEWVFLDNNGKRMSTNCFRMRCKRVCKWLNIPIRTPHKIRKTYGSILLDNGCDKNMILSQMGHTDLLTTERFYHRNRKGIERKLDILSNIPDFKAQ